MSLIYESGNTREVVPYTEIKEKNINYADCYGIVKKASAEYKDKIARANDISINDQGLMIHYEVFNLNHTAIEHLAWLLNSLADNKVHINGKLLLDTYQYNYNLFTVVTQNKIKP